MQPFGIVNPLDGPGKLFSHGELADLAFKRRNVGLVLGNDAGLSFHIVQTAVMELRLSRRCVSAVRRAIR